MTSTAIPSLKNQPSRQPPAQIPLLARIDHAEPSVFLPDVMLREARRQKNLLEGTVPEFCILDPDGDIVDHVRTVHARVALPVLGLLSYRTMGMGKRWPTLRRRRPGGGRVLRGPRR